MYIYIHLCICTAPRLFLMSRYSSGWRRCKVCLQLQILSAKKPQITGLFCRTRPINIRHPMPLFHPVRQDMGR